MAHCHVSRLTIGFCNVLSINWKKHVLTSGPYVLNCIAPYLSTTRLQCLGISKWKSASHPCSAFLFGTPSKLASSGSKKENPQLSLRVLRLLVTPSGFKPETFWSVVRCSIQLSYGAISQKAMPSLNEAANIRRGKDLQSTHANYLHSDQGGQKNRTNKPRKTKHLLGIVLFDNFFQAVQTALHIAARRRDIGVIRLPIFGRQGTLLGVRS